MVQELLLRDLIDLDVLQKIQDKFSAAVGIALVTVDTEGKPVTTLSGFTDFCKAMRSTPEGYACCVASDNMGGRIAMSRERPDPYRCHCNLVDFAVPLSLRGRYVGAILAGQCRLVPEESSKLEKLIPDTPPAPWLPGLEELYYKTPEITYSKIHAAAHTLFDIAGYLVEEGYANKVAHELQAKNLRLMEESKRLLELEKSLREAELKALSYQVNPHFLFNVLNAIGRLAYFEGAKKTEKVVYGFSDMMRYILRKDVGQFVSLQSEVEHVRNYLYIQQVRMSDKFSFTINVDPKYYDVLCPFMVLQPIAENCVNYAIEPRGEKGQINISAYDDGTDMLLEIQDNGDGFATELAEAAIAGQAIRQGGTGIGLQNVNKRLTYFFGEAYRLKITSPGTKGGGTKVILRFPIHFDPLTVFSKVNAISGS